MQSEGNPHDLSRRISIFGMAAAQAVLIGLGAAIATGQAVDPAIDDQGAQVLTRGPVHEAFAGIVSYNPEPGMIVEKPPPEAIDELPPEIRPAGDNISWIPGYWGWDEERSDYLWISGTWRALPPGRQWTPGYWGSAGQGYQWTTGYWADSSLQETTYLPRPPDTVEAGPNVAAPSRDYGWTPGNWMWQQERYAWRPGYWAQGRSDWDWIPAHYVWTPRGYVFVDGYWDYRFDRRGVLYAPVYFQSGYYSRPGYSYSPVVAIGLVALMEHLFLRPNYHHYYFGDYYDRGYRNRGYYSPYAYQSSRYGYDPVYSYRRWTHRQDKDWERRYQETYDYRRDHEAARPPRTWADQKRLRHDTKESQQQQLLMASPFEQMANQKDRPVRTERVPAKERQKLADLSREVRKTREQRRTLETEGVNLDSGKTGRAIKPSKVRLPASPIVGRSPDRLEKSQAPPKPQRAATEEPKADKPSREPGPQKIRPETKRQQEPRGPETKKEQKTPQTQKPRLETERPVENPKKELRPEPRVKSREQAREPQQEPRRREPELQTKHTQPSPERRAEKPARPEPPAKARQPERKTREELRQAGKDTHAMPGIQTQPKGAGKKSEPDLEDSEQPDGNAHKKERR